MKEKKKRLDKEALCERLKSVNSTNFILVTYSLKSVCHLLLQIQSQVSRFKHFTEEIARNQGLVHIFEKIFFALDLKSEQKNECNFDKSNLLVQNLFEKETVLC